MKISHQTHSRGVALIVALAFIVIVSVLVVGLSETLRTERSAVKTHLERQRATTMAQHGTDLVMSRLQQYTVDSPRGTGESEAAVDKRTRHWISQPGRLLVADPANLGKKPKQLEAEVPLSSGLPDQRLLNKDFALADYFPPNLNDPLLLEPETHLITEELAGGGMVGDEGTENASTVQMPVRWIYVRKDGTTVRNSDDTDWDDVPNATDMSNPLVGRFAFWADDESTKINYNLAWTRDASLNKQPPGHPTRIDLRALRDFTDTTANELHSFVTTNEYRDIGRFFNTPFDARYTASPELLKALNTNRFNLTHYNHEPDTTYYGRYRMVLTTQLSNAVLRDASGKIVEINGKVQTRPYLDILRRPNDKKLDYIEPAYVDNIDPNKLRLVIKNLVDNYLKKNDWPMADGHSIQEKYYGSYAPAAREQRLTQLAVNIIDYVRSAESKRTIVEPIRGKYINPSTFQVDFEVGQQVQGKEDTFKGTVRGPYMTEMGYWISNVPETRQGKLYYKTIGLVEIYLPENYGYDQLNLEEWQLYFGEFGGRYGDPTPTDPNRTSSIYVKANGSEATNEDKIRHRDAFTVPNPVSPVFVWDAVGNPSKLIMKPGEYRTLAFEVWRKEVRGKPSTVNIRTAFSFTKNPNDPSIPRRADGALVNYRIDVAPLSEDTTPRRYTVVPGGHPLAVASYETADPRVNGLATDWKLSTAAAKNTFSGRNSWWNETVGKDPVIKGTEPEQDTDRSGKVTAESLRMPYPLGHEKNKTGRVRSSGELGLIHTGIEGSSTQGKSVPWRTLHLQPSKLKTVMPDWAFMDLFTPPVDVPDKARSLFAPHGTSAGGRVNMNANPEPFSQSEYKLVRSEPLAAVLFRSRKSSADVNKLVTEGEARTLARNIYDRVLAKDGKPWGSVNFPCYESPGEVVEIKGIADDGEESEELVREISNLITARGNTFAVYSIGQAIQQSPNGKLTVTAEQRQHVLVERYTDINNKVHVGPVYFRNLIP